MIKNEMLQVVAEYDGYKVVKQMPRAYGGGASMYKLITFKRCIKYLTSLDWLHPVAMKVLKSLECEDRGDLPSEFWNIVNCCHLQPINGEYIDLFNAVCDGIVFLNSNNQTI